MAFADGIWSLSLVETLFMAEIDPIFIKLDQLITLSRLNHLATMMSTDRTSRLSQMAAALERLRPGAYLLGTGPATASIIPLTVDEIVLGRAATPLETPSDVVVDCMANDTLYFSPCEVSRAHAAIRRRADRSGAEYVACDLQSSRGTYVNGQRLDPESSGISLAHGDVLSLGPSNANTYMFYVAPMENGDSPPERSVG